MAHEPIQYYNRYTRRVETEQVYGEGFLRWTYGNPLGRVCLHTFVKRAFFSRWYGRRMDAPASREKIAPFIKSYGLDVSEFAAPPESFRTFNEFFYRELAASARPIHPDPAVAVFPADGRHLGFQNIREAPGLFVKGQTFSLEDLCGDRALADKYRDGSMVLSRLCPVDYHRFHFPVAGIPTAPMLLNGPLYSVSPVALRRNIRYLAENKRNLTRIATGAFGDVLMFEVGATMVGGFSYTYSPDQPVFKGQEKGYFRFGGSETITLFEPGRIRLADDLIENSRQGRELYAKMGDEMGRLPR